jgi:large subunit ribosomal protein L29
VRAKELRERSHEELSRMLMDNRAQLFQYRLQNATHQLDKTSKIRTVRREIARINTVLAQKAQDSVTDSVSTKGDEE